MASKAPQKKRPRASRKGWQRSQKTQNFFIEPRLGFSKFSLLSTSVAITSGRGEKKIVDASDSQSNDGWRSLRINLLPLSLVSISWEEKMNQVRSALHVPPFCCRPKTNAMSIKTPLGMAVPATTFHESWANAFPLLISSACRLMLRIWLGRKIYVAFELLTLR
jgi:hypothetical protein